MASVVGTYARALADVVVRKKLDAPKVMQQLNDFAQLLGDSSPLRQVLENPSVPSNQKLAVIDGIAQRAALSREARNFIAIIVDHKRLLMFHEILKQIQAELNERLGIADAEVVSVRDLNDSEKRVLEAEISKLTGKRVHARYQRDASILGGAVVKVGSTIYDGSVKGQLEKIRQQLVES